jgi:predicted O-linked N-acetylglucosamine transferase (SPINDLY family)
MSAEVLSNALAKSIARDLSVADLVRIADLLKSDTPPSAIENLYATWIGHNADHPMLFAVLFNHAVLLTDIGQLDAARDTLTRCAELNPGFMPAYINLGRVYERQGNIHLALTQWSAALSKMTTIDGAAITHKTTALNQSARALEAANSDELAENFLRQSLDLDPRQREVTQHLVAIRQRQCKWPVIEPTERVSRPTLLKGISPLSSAALADDPLFQLTGNWNYNRLDVGAPANLIQSWPSAANHTGPLRIGYLSSDLREHAVGYLMTEVFSLHDRANVDVFAYYCGIDSSDAMHEHFKKTADHFVNISHLDDAAATQRIVDDGIQILIDLNGYTREARLKVLANRPAPVIVNWLGFPGSMASPYHNYLIADDFIIPPDHELYYTEKVLCLPCYQPSNRRRPVAQHKSTRKDAGLPEDAVVFCCFNGTHKLTRQTFDRWLAILALVPGSVLWLLSSIDSTDQRLREYAHAKGIAGERIVFAQKLANPFHLARYELADLFLDTFPYGAHTTANDALFMSVPVLTLTGQSFASRVCGSLLRAAGVPELICTSGEQFTHRAIELASDPAQLRSLRQRLRETRDSCVLFDTPGLVRRLESLYQQMWSDYQAGQLPQPNLTNLDAYLEVACATLDENLDQESSDGYRQRWANNLLNRNRYRPIPPGRF